MILRYAQSKDESAELLRMVLTRMGQHDAAFNPLTYTVWFEYVAGMNVQLMQALDQLMRARPRLTDVDMRDLYQAHIADVDPRAMHRIGNELQQVMATLADTAGNTGSNAGQFGVQLEALSVGLQALNDKLTAPMVLQAIASTARMRDSAQALESEVKVCQSEIQRLQSELTRVRDESLLDALTQVLNRKGFDEKLVHMLTQPVPEGRMHGLIMLDIDYFKKVNDAHGHVMGDRVVQAVGEVLKSCLLPLSSASVALHEAGEDACSLTARADAALYRSKQDGRDRVTCA